MRSWWFSVSIGLMGAGLLAFLLLRMRETISTPEALYAIQIAAATKAVSADSYGRNVSAALALLEPCCKAGAWPVAGALIQGDSEFAPRDPEDPLLKMLVVRVRPQENLDHDGIDGWAPLGDPPWLLGPERWVSAHPNLGPISVGELLIEPRRMRYLPLRTGQPVVMDVGDLTEVRVALNSFEIRGGDEVYGFTGMHLWRAVAAVSYLKGMHTRWDASAGVIRGLAPHDGTSCWPDPPSPDWLEARLAALTKGGGWRGRVAVILGEIDLEERVERFLVGHCCDAVEVLETEPERALVALDFASIFLTVLPVMITGIDIHAMSVDLRSAAWVWSQDWEPLRNLVKELEPWAHEATPGVALTELIAAVEAAATGTEVVFECVDEGFPESALVAALRGQLPPVCD
jgi:hypothetical protein